MRPLLLLSWATALTLAAPVTFGNQDKIQIDDSDLLKLRHASPMEHHPERSSQSPRGSCYLMNFFRAAPRYLSKSLSRIETVGAESRLLPVFWLKGHGRGQKGHGRHGEDGDGHAPATSLEMTDVHEAKHGSKFMELAEERGGRHHHRRPWAGRRHRGHGRHRHHSRAHTLLHTGMVWAHIVSFLFLVTFTILYVVTFVLRKTREESKRLEEQLRLLSEKQASEKPLSEKEVLSEKEALIVIEEV